MYRALTFFAIVTLAGCATDTAQSSADVRVVVGTVSSYEQVVALSHASRGSRYHSRLDIITPSELAARLMTIDSAKPLSPRHPLAVIGATVEVKIDGLERYRGVEYKVEPFSGVIHYSVPMSAVVTVRILKEPNKALEPTPTAGTSAAKQPRVPAFGVAHL